MWQVAKATIVRNHISNQRAYPWTFSLGHIVGGIYLVLVSFFSYHYLIHGQLNARFAKYAGSHDYLSFAIIGGLLGTLSISMLMNVSRALITELREGTLEVLLLSPARKSGYFLGTTIQQMYRIGLEFIPVMILGLFLGLRLTHANWMSVFPALLLYLFACFAMALVLGAVMVSTRDTYIVQNTLFAMTALVCGFQFPTQYLPAPLQWLGQIFPLTQSLQLLRDSVLSGTSIWDAWQQVTDVISLCIIYSLVGIIAIKHVLRHVFERSIA
ncbi:ABC transporter permease [Alicyclobacillus sp. SO9]|uniref:ABC transporter permease n=1 Tax=Alicyclobacillus sp. SO9 TaxID=2665646 RepID=UPI0018E73269|nr:ABC transporter permease [Alicyclobacillus sp. SO9]QQE77107.1 ABC transporter permease [Alicyclobacillus sp. SO9]